MFHVYLSFYFFGFTGKYLCSVQYIFNMCNYFVYSSRDFEKNVWEIDWINNPVLSCWYLKAKPWTRLTGAKMSVQKHPLQQVSVCTISPYCRVHAGIYYGNDLCSFSNDAQPRVPSCTVYCFPDTFIVFTSYGIGDNPRQKIGLTRRSNTNHAAYISIVRLSKYICLIGIPINQLTSKLLRHWLHCLIA